MLSLSPPRREPVPLRDYQQECLDTVMAEWFEGVNHQLIEMPTGSGKTMTFINLIPRVDRRTVIMVHRDELVGQTLRQIANVLPDYTTSVCKAEMGRTVTELQTDIVVASAQTLAHHKRFDTLKKAIGKGALLISDEAHTDMAPSRRRVIKEGDWELVTGWTATPTRGDKQNLGDIYEKIVYRVYMSELVARGILARPIGIRIGTAVNLDAVKMGQSDGEKDFAQGELEVAVNTSDRNQLIHDAWKEHAWSKGKTRAVAFCVDVKHTIDLCNTFRENGVTAEYVVGDTPPHERKRIFEAFRDGECNVLVSCSVLVEGWDEPRADCALMARPTRSQARYIQSVGRVLRKWPGKTEAVILDFVDIFRHSLQSVTVLANSNTVTERDTPERQPVDIMRIAAEREERMAIVRLGSERVGSLITDSEYTWQVSKGGRFMVSTGDDRYIACVPVEGGLFIPVEIHAPRNAKARYRRLFDRPLDADTAMGIATSKIERSPLTVKGEAWRAKPPSEGQLKAAKWYHIKNAKMMTCGELSDALSMAAFDQAYEAAGLVSLEKGF